MNTAFSALFLLAQIVGGDFTYTVRAADSLTRVSARFGIDVRVLAERNGLTPSSVLRVSQELRIDNRHIVPSVKDVDIVINIPQRMLFHLERNRPRCAYPVAAGKAGWRTPQGDFQIVLKEEKPTWDVPVSIQEEMRRSGKAVVTRVPPSPENPLGDHWIGLSLPGVGIHGTNAPADIYKLVTHGCIRLHPEDIRDLFSRVDVGMRGRVVYEPVLVTRVGDSIFVEVHPDPFNKVTDPLRTVLDVAESEDFLDLIDPSLVEEVIRKRDGIAQDVTRRSTGPPKPAR
jgi:L,D-transpeptidase ErfK/SrfK